MLGESIRAPIHVRNDRAATQRRATSHPKTSSGPFYRFNEKTVATHSGKHIKVVRQFYGGPHRLRDTPASYLEIWQQLIKRSELIRTSRKETSLQNGNSYV